MDYADRFRHFKLWLTQALRAGNFFPPSTQLRVDAAEYWNSTGGPEQNVLLGEQIQRIWDACRDLHFVNVDLRHAATRALGAVEATAATFHETLQARLLPSKTAVQILHRRLKDMERIQNQRDDGAFTQYLQVYLQQFLAPSQTDMENTKNWSDTLDDFQGLHWEQSVVQELTEVAMSIRDHIPVRNPSLSPAAHVASSAAKCTRENDDPNEGSARSLRVANKSNVPPDVSAEAGAAHVTSPQRLLASLARKARDIDNSPESDLDHGPDKLESLPRPPGGTPGTYATWILDNKARLPVEYI